MSVPLFWGLANLINGQFDVKIHVDFKPFIQNSTTCLNQETCSKLLMAIYTGEIVESHHFEASVRPS